MMTHIQKTPLLAVLASVPAVPASVPANFSGNVLCGGALVSEPLSSGAPCVAGPSSDACMLSSFFFARACPIPSSRVGILRRRAAAAAGPAGRSARGRSTLFPPIQKRSQCTTQHFCLTRRHLLLRAARGTADSNLHTASFPPRNRYRYRVSQLVPERPRLHFLHSRTTPFYYANQHLPRRPDRKYARAQTRGRLRRGAREGSGPLQIRVRLRRGAREGSGPLQIRVRLRRGAREGSGPLQIRVRLRRGAREAEG
jgi:hypothetical protein